MLEDNKSFDRANAYVEKIQNSIEPVEDTEAIIGALAFVIGINSINWPLSPNPAGIEVAVLHMMRCGAKAAQRMKDESPKH